MAIFYKGIGPGTHWSSVDLCSRGLQPRDPGSSPGLSTLMSHIGHGTTYSCYISLTRSYGIAQAYAYAGTVVPSNTSPGYVYELELDDPLPSGLAVIDPLVEIAQGLPNRLAQQSYHHDGDPDFLIGVINPTKMVAQKVKDPPGSIRTPRQPHLSMELETLVRVLRDAEVLVAGNLPAACFKHRYPVF